MFFFGFFHNCPEVLDIRFYFQLVSFIYIIVQDSFVPFFCFLNFQISYVPFLFFCRCYSFSFIQGANQRYMILLEVSSGIYFNDCAPVPEALIDQHILFGQVCR